MTTPTTEMVAKGGRARVRTRPTCAGTLRDDIVMMRTQSCAITWPNDRFRADPVGLAHNILGQDPWEKQCEILEAIRDYDRVSVVSGHKIGKSHTAGMAAFWFFLSFDDARVVMSSSTARQVDEILWREVRKMKARAGVCLECKRAAVKLSPAERAKLPFPCEHSSRIDGKISQLARSGLEATDLRQIVGFTAREPEAVAGVSGENILYIIDEASGVDDAIFEAIEGNRAGGAKILLFSNGTKTEGEFFESHHDKALQFEKDGTPSLDANGRQKGFYYAITVSSEETPNAKSGKKLIPGLATREWIEEKKLEWGEDSALYIVRVKGGFALNESGKIVSLHLLGEAEKRWEDTEPDGPLCIGLDPAGPGDAGDETVFAVRRGMKLLALVAKRELDEDAIARELLDILRLHRRPREPKPTVIVDSEGSIGAKVYGKLCAVAAAIKVDEKQFELVRVRSSERSFAEGYDRVRDELWANVTRWLRDGGSLLEDTKLEKELHAPSWIAVPGNKVKATPKSELKSILGRSPDRADAVCLAVWSGRAAVLDESDEDELELAAAANDPYGAGDGINPYDGLDVWERES